MTRLVQPKSFIRNPLDVILSGTGSVRVLRALAAHGGALSVSRLAGDTHMTSMGVRGALASLEMTRVVETIGSGHSRLYRMRESHPITVALARLFDAEKAWFGGIEGAIVAAASDSRIVAVWLFGSVSRHEDTVRSDIDLAILARVEDIEFDEIVEAFRENLARAGDRMGFTPSVIAITVADARRLSLERDGFWASLVRDARAIKGPSPRETERMWDRTISSEAVHV